MYDAATRFAEADSVSGDSGPPKATAAPRRTSATAHGPSTTAYSPASTLHGVAAAEQRLGLGSQRGWRRARAGRTAVAVSSSDRPGTPWRRTRSSPKLRSSYARTPLVEAIAVLAAAARQPSQSRRPSGGSSRSTLAS